MMDMTSTGPWPQDARAFAEAVIRAICGASVTPDVARRAYERCRRALELGATARMGFRHPGKAEAIDRIWRERETLYAAFVAADDQYAYLASLPWVGPVIQGRLAREFGLGHASEHTSGEAARAAA
jgi:hypothetical protein